jgi:hypothetical protein
MSNERRPPDPWLGCGILLGLVMLLVGLGISIGLAIAKGVQC